MTLSSSTIISTPPVSSQVPPRHTQFIWIGVAFAVGACVCGVIVLLGALEMFGTISTIGFTIAVVGGGTVCVLCVGGAIWSTTVYCKNRVSKNNPVDEPVDLGEDITEEERVVGEITQKLGKEKISDILRAIPPIFFSDKSQERAKAVFVQAMKKLHNATVHFPKAGPLENPEGLTGQLNTAVFQLSHTMGVERDIPRSSKDSKHIHLYQVASQYNAGESANCKLTPPIGGAMEKSEHDASQGPLAQRTNPLIFELVTAFLTHLGFNMYHRVMPSAGKTYEAGAPIEHGYLRPVDKTLAQLTDELVLNFAEAEYVCYSSCADEWGEGSHPVYLLLQAAPYPGAPELTRSCEQLQKYAALANYLALFREGIALAQEFGKPVVVHATGVGGGVFGNEAKNLQWGFEKAALALQTQMKAAGVIVQ